MTSLTTLAGPSALRARAAALLAALDSVPLAPIQFAFRIAIGSVFFKSGLLKINSWEFAILLFRDEYKVPASPPATGLAKSSESATS